MKTNEERQKDIDSIVNVVDGNIVGNVRLTELREYLIVHNIHACVYCGGELMLSTHNGTMVDEADVYNLWKENRIEVVRQTSDWIEEFHIKIIIEDE